MDTLTPTVSPRYQRKDPGNTRTPASLAWAVRLVLGVYDFLLSLVAAGWLMVRLVWPPDRGRRAVAERLGYVPMRPDGKSASVWIHAVSIGELLSVLPVLRLLKERHPDWWILLSTTQRYADQMAHSRPTGADAVCLLPWDCGFAIETAFNRARPDLFVLVECELWPNFIVRSGKRNIDVLMINARLYERDLPRYLMARWFFAPVLRLLSAVAAQSEADGQRFLQLGMATERLLVTGSTKFDADLPADVSARLSEMRRRLPLNGGLLWVLASTHANEEQQILARFGLLQQRFPDIQLLIAPRHIERGTQIQELAGNLGLRAVLRSQLPSELGTPHIIILDTVGELRTALGLADLVFVGGSLVDKGGQNPIEPALHVKPILMGPSIRNFEEIVRAFVLGEGLVLVPNADELMEQALELLANADHRQHLGQCAASVVGHNRGAAETSIQLLESAMARRRAAALPVALASFGQAD